MRQEANEHRTVQGLRADAALQLSRAIRDLDTTQMAAAKELGLPQPTLSKILNGQVHDVSLELLIRVAARLGLPLAIQTGRAPEEAGVFAAGGSTRGRAVYSAVADAARQSAENSVRLLSLPERLAAFVAHNELMIALHGAGREVQGQTGETA